MNALRIVFALIRIPRLFFTLLFFPFLLSLVLVYVQLVLTGVVLKASSKEAQDVQRNLDSVNRKSIQRQLIYGSDEPLPTLRVCRWREIIDEKGRAGEVPPSKACSPDRLDAAIQTVSPADFDEAPYLPVYEGNVYRLHICRSCTPDIITRISGSQIETSTYSSFGLMILQLALYNSEVQDRISQALQASRDTRNLLGNMFFVPSQAEPAISLTGILASIMIPINVALLVLVALWLALKAHKKVLDYFARNGALLPMVAATGGSTFYAALWILTVLRVAAFLGAAIPLAYLELNAMSKKGNIFGVLYDYGFSNYFWLAALGTGLALAAIIASIAELKHRHSLLSFTYRYVPLLCAAAGALVWAASFLLDGQSTIRTALTALPIVGLAPVLVAPVFKPADFSLTAHALLSGLLLVLILRSNSRWFAAHLEEL